MIQARSAPDLGIPSEVVEFAAHEGVVEELPAVLEMTRRVFPGATMRVFLEDDPEIPNDRHIIVEAVGVQAASIEAAVDARYLWHEELFARCPAPKVCVFRLAMELAS